MFTYKPLYSANQIKCGSGQIAIITGWTDKDLISKKLDSKLYAVIGQLYSPTRGISGLLSNLLANPHVRFIVALRETEEDDNAGAIACLLHFFHNGFQEGFDILGCRCWVIPSDIVGYIDIEIEADALERLRKNISIHDARTTQELLAVVEATQAVLEPWGEPLIFPRKEIIPTIYPGPQYGHRIQGRTVAETWVKIIHRIKTTGTIRPTGHDAKWQELINLTAIVTDEPADFYFPEPNYLPISRKFIQQYVGNFLNDAPYRKGIIGYTYGNRLRSWFECDQIEQVIEKLVGEIDAASAVMSLWDVRDHETGGSPCLNHIWVRVINGVLSLTALFRSNDMFAAWPANAMGLRSLQQHIFEEVSRRSSHCLNLGPLITISQSAHIYDDTWESADALIRNQYAEIARSQHKTFEDASGNFVVEVSGDQIIVSHTTSGSGQVVTQYSGKFPLKIVREICAASPAILPEHAAYLGIELQTALDCIRTNRPYRQDRFYLY